VVAGYSGYRDAGGPPDRHRGLPSPYLTLIFTLDDPLHVTEHPDPQAAPDRYDALVGGLHTTAALIVHEGRQSGVQVALLPLAARAVLGLPAGELASLDVHADHVLGPFAEQVRERLLAVEGWPARFAALDEALLQRVNQARLPEPGPEVTHAWNRLLATAGQVSVARLAADVGWSTRNLNRQFSIELGLGPKAAARVIRFDRARRELQRRATAAGRPPALAEIAADFGYFDQAHLAAEFSTLAGCPPSRWLSEEVRFGQAGAGPVEAGSAV
jgi:AraC-like DNA-binding protein